MPGQFELVSLGRQRASSGEGRSVLDYDELFSLSQSVVDDPSTAHTRSYITRVVIWLIFSFVWMTSFSPRNRTGIAADARIVEGALPWRHALTANSTDIMRAIYIQCGGQAMLRGKYSYEMTTFQFFSSSLTPSTLKMSKELDYVSLMDSSTLERLVWSETRNCFSLPSGSCLKLATNFSVRDLIEIPGEFQSVIALIVHDTENAFSCLRAHDKLSGQCLSSIEIPSISERIVYDAATALITVFHFSQGGSSANLYKYGASGLQRIGKIMLMLPFTTLNSAWFLHRKRMMDGFLVFTGSASEGGVSSIGISLMSGLLGDTFLQIGDVVTSSHSPGLLRVQRLPFVELSGIVEGDKCSCVTPL